MEILGDKAQRVLFSARGDKLIKFSLIDSGRNESAFSILSLDILGDFYDRSVDLSGSSIVRDFAVSFPQIRVAKDAISRLDFFFDKWLRDQSSFECVMSVESYRDQFLALYLGCSDEFISSPNKPCVTVEYKSGPVISTRVSFLIDQSCVAAWFVEP